MDDGSQVEKIIFTQGCPNSVSHFNKMSHTILLTQPARSKSSRTYSDHENISLAVEEIIRSYESKLKEMNPTVRDITYDIKDLYNFVDHFADIGILVYDTKLKGYLPHDREWLKGKILAHLQRSAK